VFFLFFKNTFFYEFYNREYVVCFSFLVAAAGTAFKLEQKEERYLLNFVLFLYI